MVFAWVSAGLPQGFAGFVQVFQFAEGFPRFLRVSFGFLQICLGGWPGFSFFPEILKPQASKSWRRRKIITVIAQCCAKSYIFAGTVSGAINGGNFATLLRGASTVIQISVANLDLNSTS